MSFSACRMSASGNSFLLIDEEKCTGDTSLSQWGQRQDWVKNYFLLMDLDLDGLLFLKKKATEKIIWDFYNRDGSRAEMCGNAARCIGKYYFDREPHWKSIQLETLAGFVSLGKEEEIIRVEMPKVQIHAQKHRILWDKESIEGVWVDTGVPHFVLNGKDYKKSFAIANFCRHHESFSPRGTNVTFFEFLSTGNIQAVSFERGVENFTLACGTGAVAAALSHSLAMAKVSSSSVEVHLPGGQVRVELEGAKAELIGGAQYD